jgi:hypothetical protein
MKYIPSSQILRCHGLQKRILRCPRPCHMSMAHTALKSSDDGILTPVDEMMTMIENRYPKKDRSSVQKTRERVERVLGQDDSRERLQAFEKKLDLLDSLKFGLGYKVLHKYTEEFMDEDAYELWSIMSAILFMTGFHPESIGLLFQRHPCLFANSVRDPDNLKLLFDWMKQNGLQEKESLRIINRYPLILQTSVHKVLEPRLLYLCNALHVDREVVLQGIIRHPELLSVESLWIQKRIDYYFYLGLSTQDVQKLFVAQPSAFAVNIEKYLIPMAALLQDVVFENSNHDVFVSVLVKSGILSRSVSTIRGRIDAWLEVGLTMADVCLALKRFPRFLLYPISDSKYIRKIEFLEREMNLSVKASIPAFPQYLSYSLENRIAPRVLAIKAITGNVPRLTTLAMGDKAFMNANKVNPVTYAAILKKLPETEKGTIWLKE